VASEAQTLLELANLDKSDARTDKGDHGYLPVYEELFSAFRDTTLPILEIGVGMGGSLRVWARWFPNAEIHGIDIRPVPSLEARIHTHQGDTMDADFIQLVAALGPFALIIDDGGHVGDEQEAAFRALWPALAQGGVYVIEDLHASYMPEFEPSVMPFLKSVVDSVNQKGEFSDVLAVQFYPKLFIAAKRMETPN